MPAMVFIEELAAKLPKPTFFLLTPGDRDKGGSCLRDYSDPRGAKPVEVMRQQPPEWTLDKVERLARRLDDRNRYQTVLEHDVNDYDYWHKKTVEFNKKLPPPDRRGGSEGKGWWEHLKYVVATATAAIIAAGVITWLKWK